MSDKNLKTLISMYERLMNDVVGQMKALEEKKESLHRLYHLIRSMDPKANLPRIFEKAQLSQRGWREHIRESLAKGPMSLDEMTEGGLSLWPTLEKRMIRRRLSQSLCLMENEGEVKEVGGKRGKGGGGGKWQFKK